MEKKHNTKRENERNERAETEENEGSHRRRETRGKKNK